MISTPGFPRYTLYRNGHDLIVGPKGGGKTWAAEQLITEEHAAGTEIWIIDPNGGQALPEWWDKAVRYARSVSEARPVLAEVHHRTPEDQPALILVEDAPAVLADEICRRLVEEILPVARKLQLRFRLIVPSADLSCFGGSELIRSAVLSGAAS